MRILKAVGLHRRELRAWAMYDWANSAFMTVVIASVFPIFFAQVANSGTDPQTATSRFTVATIVSLAIIAVIAPVLGAIADQIPIRKKLLGAFLALGALCTAAMAWIDSGHWQLASVLFVLARIGAMGSIVFYDSLLPHICETEEIDSVSTAGYAIGYLGGGILLGVLLAAIANAPIAGLSSADLTRIGFVVVALWWVGFALPLFFRVPEPPSQNKSIQMGAALRDSFSSLRNTLHELKKYRQATLFLLAFLVYNDGIGTIIKLAVIYGSEVGLAKEHLIAAILITQFVGIPCTFAFGQMARWTGTKRSIFIALAVYTVVSVIGYFMRTPLHFYLLAGLVGMVQGGTQALSRSLFASMIPIHKATEFFGLFAVFEKFAGILGPAVFWLMLTFTGSSRNGILAVILFFALGAWLLSRVDVQAGRRTALAHDL